MKIVVISDTHEQHDKVIIPQCDILIHCGDFSVTGKKKHIEAFLQWFSGQPAKHKIYIAGNHDLNYEKNHQFKKEMIEKFSNLVYLENSFVEIMGLKFFGSPYTPEFMDWSFDYDRGSQFAVDLWNKISRDTDILISHGPPKNILDQCKFGHAFYPQYAGCEILRHRVEELNLKYVLFGHIHEGYGMDPYTLAPTICVNASTCDLSYRPNNKPVELDV